MVSPQCVNLPNSFLESLESWLFGTGIKDPMFTLPWSQSQNGYSDSVCRAHRSSAVFVPLEIASSRPVSLYHMFAGRWMRSSESPPELTEWIIPAVPAIVGAHGLLLFSLLSVMLPSASLNVM